MAEEGFKRKLTSVLSADAVGYSRLMEDDEVATVRTITSYRSVISTLIKQHNGKVIDSPGDNLLAEFVSVVDAVAGLAGALFAAVTEFVSPTMLGFGLSTEVLIWVALGGKEVLLASFLGAMLVRVLESYLSDLLTYYWILILGLFFFLCYVFSERCVR